MGTCLSGLVNPQRRRRRLELQLLSWLLLLLVLLLLLLLLLFLVLVVPHLGTNSPLQERGGQWRHGRHRSRRLAS